MKIPKLLATFAILAVCSVSALATPIYAITQNNDLLFYKHSGFNNGSSNWPVQGRKIGNGWGFKQVFTSDSGAVYAIAENGDMFFYKHAGYTDGTANWPKQSVKIGNGWNFKQVFAGVNGAIYAIAQNGDMFFYKHTGYLNGTASWSVQSKKIGNGWNFKQVFAGDNGSIYAIAQNGDMFYYKHAGFNDGSANWPIVSRKIGNGWNFKEVFAGGAGAIYAIAQNGDMFFYKHAGYNDGSASWSIQSSKIGNGWGFKQVFAGRDTSTANFTSRSLSVSRFNTASLTNADADRILGDATSVLQTDDGPGDVACNIALSRSGNVTTFTAGDGSIDSEAEFDRVIGLGGYVKIVNAINWCDGLAPNIIGCAPVPGESLAVVRFTNNQEGILWAHEYGHTKDLPHRNDADAVMNGSIAPNRRKINANECTAFRS